MQVSPHQQQCWERWRKWGKEDDNRRLQYAHYSVAAIPEPRSRSWRAIGALNKPARPLLTRTYSSTATVKLKRLLRSMSAIGLASKEE